VTSVGPPIHVLVAGTNIGPGLTYTTDQPVVLAFDRFLDPATVTRQSVLLEDSGGDILTDELIAYDPVTLTVSLRPPSPPLAWLTPGRQYRVQLIVPSTDGGDPFGLKALDGATLAAPVDILFTAGTPPVPPSPGPPTMGFCDTILGPIFLRSCAYGSCHATAQPDAGAVTGGHPPLGLDLQTAAGVLATAVNQVADESNTGPSAATATQLPKGRFGMDMAVIAPREPGNSWLVYKTLLALPATSDADAGAGDGGPLSYGASDTSPISAAERARLSSFILGQGMPYPSPSQPEPGPSPLTQGDLERLSVWIAQGAVVPPSCP